MKAGPYSLVNDGASDISFKMVNAACALIFDGCSSHFAHLAAGKGGKAFNVVDH